MASRQAIRSISTTMACGLARSRDRPAGLLLEPVVLIALAVLVINDRVLKWRYHNLLTGKLSDVAGLIVAPAVIVGLVELGSWWSGRSRRPRARATAAMVAGLAVAAAFTAIQLDTPATAIYRFFAGLWWGREALVVADPSDLIALPAAMVPWILARTGGDDRVVVESSI